MKIYVSQKLNRKTGESIFLYNLFKTISNTYKDIVLCDNIKKAKVCFHSPESFSDNFNKKSKNITIVSKMFLEKSLINDTNNNRIKTSVNESDAVVFDSEFIKNCCIKNDIIPNKSHIIYNGVNLKDISELDAHPVINKDSVVCCGFWKKHKRLEEIIHSFLLSGIEHKLYVIGEPTKSVYEKYSKNNNICFLWEQGTKNSIRIMKSCKFGICLDKLQSSSYSVNYQLACGLPVVHCFGGGIKEVVNNESICVGSERDFDYKIGSECESININHVASIMNKAKNISKVNMNTEIDILLCAKKYYDIIKELV